MNDNQNPFPEIPNAALRQIWQRADKELMAVNPDPSTDEIISCVTMLNESAAEMKARGMEVEGE